MGCDYGTLAAVNFPSAQKTAALAVMFAARVAAAARVTTSTKVASAKALRRVTAATKGMEPPGMRRLAGKAVEALAAKPTGRLREIVVLKACRGGAEARLRIAVKRSRPIAVTVIRAGAIARAPELLCRVERRLHVVESLLRGTAVVRSRRPVTPVEAFSGTIPGKSLLRPTVIAFLSELLPIAGVVSSAGLAIVARPVVAIGQPGPESRL